MQESEIKPYLGKFVLVTFKRPKFEDKIFGILNTFDGLYDKIALRGSGADGFIVLDSEVIIKIQEVQLKGE